LNARTKLNSAHILGSLLLASVAGGFTDSTTVFLGAAAVLIALAVHDGGIRTSGGR
jgi:hypothetical protein